MNPALLLLLIGGGGLALSRIRGKSKAALKMSCDNLSGGNKKLVLGPHSWVLPDNVRIDVLVENNLKNGHSSALKCSSGPSKRDGEVYIQIYETLKSEFWKTKKIIDQGVLNLASDLKQIDFNISVIIESSDKGTSLAEARIRGYAPTGDLGSPGELQESTGLIANAYIQKYDDDPFTTLQFLAGNVIDGLNAYQKDGNSVLWLGDGNAPSRECSEDNEVLIGLNFLPSQMKSIIAQEESSLDDVLAMPENSAFGYVDYLLNNDPGLQSMIEKNDINGLSEQIAFDILMESGVQCGQDVALTFPKVKSFYKWITWAIKPWISDYLGGIPFDK